MAQEFKQGKSNITAWAKIKTKKSKSGEEYEVFRATIDTGAGKMITLEMYADLEPRLVNDEPMLPIRVSKWKGQPKQNRKSRASW